MKAAVGDKIVIMSQHLGEHVREGEIIEVHGADGEPPYVVRWYDEEHTAVFFPGADARIEHHQANQASPGGT